MGKLKMQNPTVSDDYFLGCFISGLKEHIKLPLRSHNPTSLVQAYALARNYDSSTHKKTQFDTSRVASRYTSPFKQQSMPFKKEENETKQQTANKWEKGKCFKCQEQWVPGHNRVCKFKNQVHLITIQDDATYDQDCEDNNSQESSQEVEDSPELQISMHAI
jgi:hypothetical protein